MTTNARVAATASTSLSGHLVARRETVTAKSGKSKELVFARIDANACTGWSPLRAWRPAPPRPSSSRNRKTASFGFSPMLDRITNILVVGIGGQRHDRRRKCWPAPL
ncbi:MAG: hypothetical protein U1F42_04435 [Candidatus Competibacteraceae bacterium]